MRVTCQELQNADTIARLFKIHSECIIVKKLLRLSERRLLEHFAISIMKLLGLFVPLAIGILVPFSVLIFVFCGPSSKQYGDTFSNIVTDSLSEKLVQATKFRDDQCSREVQNAPVNESSTNVESEKNIPSISSDAASMIKNDDEGGIGAALLKLVVLVPSGSLSWFFCGQTYLSSSGCSESDKEASVNSVSHEKSPEIETSANLAISESGTISLSFGEEYYSLWRLEDKEHIDWIADDDYEDQLLSNP